uniref:Uncharacterized protein n=1 Tax=Physcomitrium patens TaxID=3218 RepID=A0A2K1J3Q2_PHYPA|nr:hypothetical protein PHYPA_022004 [Physcomitrium patens]
MAVIPAVSFALWLVRMKSSTFQNYERPEFIPTQVLPKSYYRKKATDFSFVFCLCCDESGLAFVDCIQLGFGKMK